MTSKKRNLRDRIKEQTKNLGSSNYTPVRKERSTLMPEDMPKTGPGAMGAYAHARAKVEELQKDAQNQRTVLLSSIDPNPWARSPAPPDEAPEAQGHPQDAPRAQPEAIVVRISPDTAERFQIVQGERRWRHLQALQVVEVDVFVGEFTDVHMFMLARGARLV
ncbi:ParB N-terminal domain-containing protein [Pollutimonas subterranea]|nr:ParB N-terminal domain-containing protein [Pollutimonas subterranea]